LHEKFEPHAPTFSSPDEREVHGEPHRAQEFEPEETPRAAPLEPSHPSGESRNGAETGLRERATQDEEPAPASAGEKPAASAEEAGETQPAATTAEKPAEPVLTSTYDPRRAKRAGWWSRVRSP
jgi:ribonuclease E